MTDKGLKVLSESLPQCRRTSLELTGLEQPDHRMSDGAGQRVASEGRPVVARVDHFHDRARRDQSRHGHDPTAEGLAEDVHVRHDVLKLTGEGAAGAAKSRLCLLYTSDAAD